MVMTKTPSNQGRITSVVPIVVGGISAAIALSILVGLAYYCHDKSWLPKVCRICRSKHPSNGRSPMRGVFSMESYEIEAILPHRNSGSGSGERPVPQLLNQSAWR